MVATVRSGLRTFRPLFRLIQGGPLRPPPASSEETRQEAVALATRLVDAVVQS